MVITHGIMNQLSCTCCCPLLLAGVSVELSESIEIKNELLLKYGTQKNRFIYFKITFSKVFETFFFLQFSKFEKRYFFRFLLIEQPFSTAGSLNFVKSAQNKTV